MIRRVASGNARIPVPEPLEGRCNLPNRPFLETMSSVVWKLDFAFAAYLFVPWYWQKLHREPEIKKPSTQEI